MWRIRPLGVGIRDVEEARQHQRQEVPAINRVVGWTQVQKPSGFDLVAFPSRESALGFVEPHLHIFEKKFDDGGSF